MANNTVEFLNWSGRTLKQVDDIRAKCIAVAASADNSYAYALPDNTLKGRTDADKREQLFDAFRKVTTGLDEACAILEFLQPEI